MSKRKVSKILLAALMVSAIGAMSSMSAFAANTVITDGNWIDSDYVAADAEHGVAEDLGTAVRTHHTITVTDVADTSAGLTVRAYQLVHGTYKDGKLTGYVLCDATNAPIADMEAPTVAEITTIANNIRANTTTLQGIQMTKGTGAQSNSYTATVEAGLYVVLASGSDVILLDVKAGKGAFMKTVEDAKKLAEALVSIGNRAGKKTMAVITDMDQPLNTHIGNALEVKEVFETLSGQHKNSALREISVYLSANLIMMAGLADSLEKAIAIANDMIDSGKAKEKMRELLECQAGSSKALDDPSLLPKAPVVMPVSLDVDGWIKEIDVLELGISARDLGAGRIKKEDSIDPAVGIVMNKRVGDKISKGETIAYIHASSEESAKEAIERLKKSITISATEVEHKPLILGKVE